MATESQGTVISVRDGFGSYLEIDGVVSIRDVRSGSVEQIEITDVRSAAREFSPGLRDEGAMTLDVIYLPSDPGQERLIELRDSGSVGEFLIEVPTVPVFVMEFSGLVPAFPITFSIDDVLRGSATIRITGAIDETFEEGIMAFGGTTASPGSEIFAFGGTTASPGSEIPIYPEMS